MDLTLDFLETPFNFKKTKNYGKATNQSKKMA